MSIGYMLLRLVFFKSTIEHVAYPGNSLVTNFLTMTKVIASYIKLWFFPIVLNPDYHVTFETTPIKLPFSHIPRPAGMYRISCGKALSQAKGNNLCHSLDIYHIDTGYESYPYWQYHGRKVSVSPFVRFLPVCGDTDS